VRTWEGVLSGFPLPFEREEGGGGGAAFLRCDAEMGWLEGCRASQAARREGDVVGRR